MEPTKVTSLLAGSEITIETGTFAHQAHGAATVRIGETIVLATATMSENANEGMDFFPLTVSFEERFYAAGKIKGSRFIKREGRPSDNAILTSRLIDRPLRPLFPKNTRNEVQIICTVISADMENDPDIAAMIAASVATMISGMPFEGPVGAVRIGMENGKLVVNPNYKQAMEGQLDLVVAGTEDAITMVEAGAKEVSEEQMLEALDLAHGEIKKLCALQKELVGKVKVEEKQLTVVGPGEEAIAAIEEFVTPKMLDAITGTTKKDVKEKLHGLEEKMIEHFMSDIEAEKFSKKELKEVLLEKVEKRMRENILTKEIRLDGRKLDEIRPVSCEVGIIPRTHGSGHFRRGETQVVTFTTLGAPGAAQIVDTMDEDTTKRYIHYYSFPPYSVGEVRKMFGPGRREIGHGALAERALLPVIPSEEEFPYTMLLVSEVFSCNGSSSMASVCGSTLSLMDAGVPIKKPVSAVAMGLVTDGNGAYKILTDLQGMEDFAGDMDFKVAGTADGITALQMDIKIKGLSLDIMREALAKAKAARAAILADMLKTLASPRKELSKYAPLIMKVQIKVEQIRAVIGKGGETIQKIIADTGTEIDIKEDGLVIITAPDQESGQAAVSRIKEITYEPKVGDIFEKARVTRLFEFGAMCEFAPGKEGLVHISQLKNERVNKVEDVVKVGDIVKVKLVAIDDQGRYNLSMKAATGPQ